MKALDEIRNRLNSQLSDLEKELRVDLPKEIGKALEMGDLRENAEYKAALERQEFLMTRINQIKKRLSELSLINPARIPKDRASYGSTVTLVDVDSGGEKVYRLLMPEEADVDKGWISTTSPIGKALMGKQEGDEVEIRTPSGAKTYEVAVLKTLHDEV